jgi:tRNA dimethylallyltransferase
VYRLTGEPISRLQLARSSILAGVDVVELALAPSDRELLHQRLQLRFDAMLAAGFVEEVQGLRERGDLSAEHPSMRAVGYRQIWRYLDGQCALDESRSRAIIATRQLAKRQLTWLRARPRARWVDSAQNDSKKQILNALS